jgi:hypothetical protein
MVRIASGRSCASVLIVPRRKTSLVETPHGRAAMGRVGAPWEAMESSPERGKRGGGERETGAWLGGRHEGGLLCDCCSVHIAACTWCSAWCAWGRRKEEREKKREKKRKRKRKRKEMENFLNLKKKLG